MSIPTQNFSGSYNILGPVTVLGTVTLTNKTFNGASYVSDLTELETALADCVTRGGGRVILNFNGIVNVTSPLIVGANTTLEGCGGKCATLFADNTLDDDIIHITGSGAILRNLHFDGNSANQTTGDAVQFTAANTGCLIDSCYFTDLRVDVIRAASGITSHLTVSNCVFENCDTTSTHCFRASTGFFQNTLVRNCLFENIYQMFLVDSSTSNFGLTLDSCIVRNQIDGNGFLRGDYNRILNCHFESCDGGITFSEGNNNLVDGCFFDNITTTAAINGGSLNNTIITNNVVQTCTGVGILVNGGTFQVISGNYIEDTTTYGIELNSAASDCVISGNTIINCGTAIDLNTGFRNLVIDNMFEGNATGLIEIPSGNVNSVIRNNRAEIAVTDPATLSGNYSHIKITNTGAGNISPTLADLDPVYIGHKCYIDFVDKQSTGNVLVTPANFVGQLGGTLDETTLDLTVQGDDIVLQWMGTTWKVIRENSNGSFTNNLEVTGNIVANGKVIVDDTSTETLLVRKDGDGGDILVVDTTNSKININAPAVTTGTVNVDGNVLVSNTFGLDGLRLTDSTAGNLIKLTSGNVVEIGESSGTISNCAVYTPTGAGEGIAIYADTAAAVTAFFENDGTIGFGTVTPGATSRAQIIYNDDDSVFTVSSAGTAATSIIDFTTTGDAPILTIGNTGLVDSIVLEVISENNATIRLFGGTPEISMGESGDGGGLEFGIDGSNNFNVNSQNTGYDLNFVSNDNVRATLDGTTGDLNVVGDMNVDATVAVGAGASGNAGDILLKLNGVLPWEFRQIGETTSAGLDLINVDTTTNGAFQIVADDGTGTLDLIRFNANATTSSTSTISMNGELKVLVPNGTTVGASSGQGGGTIGVSGDFYKNNTSYTTSDYVFEHEYTGSITKFIGNSGAHAYLQSGGRIGLLELEEYTRENLQFPGMAETRGIFDRTNKTLELIEELYLYFFDLNRELKELEG